MAAVVSDPAHHRKLVIADTRLVPRMAALDPSLAVLAQKFLGSVDAMNTRLGIPSTLAALREADIAALARAACHEADTNYPVPLYLSQTECEAVFRKVLLAHPAAKPKARKTAALKTPKAVPE